MPTTGDDMAPWGGGMVSSDKSPMLFVSHHSSKLDTAEHVERALNAKGVRCWIAPRDVEPGASFARAIPQAIGESSAVLLLFCANSAKSRHVERELILADQLGKAIIPLRLERIDPGELSYHLAASQWIDWLEKRDEAIDRIAVKARDLQEQAQNGVPEKGPVSIDELEAKAPIDISKPHSDARPAPAPAAPPPPVQPPVSLDRSDRPADAGAPPFRGDTGPRPGTDLPPRDYQPSEPGKPSKVPLFLALGGIGAVLLIGLAYLIISSVMTPPSTSEITEEWFAGQWSDSQNCTETYRFDPDGQLVAPNGTTGRWSIADGDTLVVEGPDGERQELRLERVGPNQVRGDDGSSSYRCD